MKSSRFQVGGVYKDRSGAMWIVEEILQDGSYYPMSARMIADAQVQSDRFRLNGCWCPHTSSYDLLEPVEDEAVLRLSPLVLKEGLIGVCRRVAELEKALYEERNRRRELERSKP